MSFGFSTGIANGLSAPDWLNEDEDTGNDTSFADSVNITLKAGWYGMANNFIQIGNFLGGDAEEYSLYDEMGSLGDDYLASKAGYDLAGDLAFSLIPGGVGLQAIKLAKLGKLGTVGSKMTGFSQKLIATNDELKIAYGAIDKTTQGASTIRKLKGKAFGYAFAAEAVEGAVISAFIDTSVHLGDILNDEGLTTLDKFTKFGGDILFWSLAPTPVFAPFTYMAKTKGSRDYLQTLNRAKTKHNFAPYAASNLHNVNYTSGSGIAHDLEQLEKINDQPITTATAVEEAFKVEVASEAKLSIKESIKKAVVGDVKVTAKDEPLINLLEDIAFSKLGTPDSYYTKQLFERGRKFELGGVPDYSPKIKAVLKNNADNMEFHSGASFLGSRRSFYKKGDKLLVNNDSKYLKHFDKALLHYFSDNYKTIRGKIEPEIKELIRTGDVSMGLDSFTALQQAYKIFSSDQAVLKAKSIIDEPHIGFAEANPALNKIFSDKQASYKYGSDRIKYADVVTGKVVELPTPFLGDLTPTLTPKSVRVEKTSSLTNKKVFKQSEDISKVSDPIQYQADKLLISQNSESIVAKVTNLDSVTIEQAVALEREVLTKVKGTKTTLTVGNSEVAIDKILAVIGKTKALEADRLLKTGMNTDTVLLTLGVTDRFMLARGNPRTTLANDFMSNTADLIKPRHLKITTDADLPSTASVSLQTTLDSARSNQMAFLSEVADFITGTKLSDTMTTLSPQMDTVPLGLNRMLQDAATIGKFNSLNVATASVGHTKNVLADANLKGKILPEIVRTGEIILGSNSASASLLSFRNWYDRQGSKFVLLEGTNDTWVKKDLTDNIKTELELGLNADDIIKGLENGTDYYQISDGNVAQFVNNFQSTNRDHVLGPQKVIENAYGNNPINSSSNLYLPPRNYPHVRYVRVTGNIFDQHSEQVYRIVGKSEEDLAEKIAKAELMGQEKKQTWAILTSEQLERNAKASKAYDWAGKDLNLGTAVSTEARSGAVTDLFPAVVASDLINETIEWLTRKNDLVYSAAVEMHYADFVAELQTLIRTERNRLDLTTQGGKIRNKIEAKIGTYEQLHAQMLGYDKGGYSPWKQLNNVTEEYASKAATVLNRIRLGLLGTGKEKTLQFKDIVEQSDLMDKELSAIGMSLPVKKMAKDVIKESSVVSKKDIRDIVSGLNHITSTLMIRLDAADTIMNAAGLVTKLSTEAQYIQELVKNNPRSQARVNKVYENYFGAGKTEIAGNEMSLTSVAKALGNAPKELLSDVGQERLKRWQKSGLAVQDAQLMSDMFQEARVQAFSFISEKNKKAYKTSLKGAVTKAVQFASKPHRMSNNYTQYVALSFAEDLGKAAGLTGGELYQYVFKVSRSVNAISTHVTKPRLFQGAIGLGMSLYQSYAFHTASQLLRHAGEGKIKPLATYAALNATFFGAQSVPGFQYLNAQIGRDPETGHADAYIAAYTALPKTAADFIMYGAGGALLQSNLSVRGNMTPRHLSVVPTSLTQFPAVTALSNFTGAVLDNAYKLAHGDQSIPQAALNTVIDSHLNRPLAGLASILMGKSVDSRHSAIIAHEETFSLASGLRIMGLKPLKEQIITSYYWRNHAYQLQDRARRNNLSEVVKIRHNRDPEFFTQPDRLIELSDQYVRSGGKIAGFNTWLENTISKGETSLESRIEEQIEGYLPYTQNFNALMKN